jgi:GNAT superfamily N-acetyltransferase
MMNLHIRRATPEDAAIIAHHRASMFREMGSINEEQAAALEASSLPILRDWLTSNNYLGWLIESEGQVIAGGGVILRPLLPRPECLHGGEEAYILNVYTEPQYRRQGAARQLLEAIIAWCRERGCARVTLHPSEEGQPLYASLGFERTKEMLLQQE